MSTLVAPRFLFMQLYTSCNLRCPHCTFWQRPHTLTAQSGWQHQRHLTLRKAITEEFSTMNPSGVVVTHGGEALLDWEGYLDYCETCRDLGLKVFTVTNGTQVFSPARAAELVLRGPSEITVSFDSVVSEEHDRFRGVVGAFDKAVRAVRLLLLARQAGDLPIKVNTMLLLGKSTSTNLPAAYEFALRELGADKLKLNAIQPSFGLNEGPDPFFAAECQVDPTALRAALLEVDAVYDLAFDPKWVDQVVMYFESIRESPNIAKGWSGNISTREHICNSPERNIWVSSSGIMQLCCDVAWGGTEWHASGDLSRYWEGEVEKRVRMASCNKLCGISHSLRNVSSTLRAVRYGAKPDVR